MISSGAGFDTHNCRSLLKGRGILFADQKLIANEKTARLARVYASDDGLIANEKTARLARVYASDDGSISRMDFAWVMMMMSGLNVLTGYQGQV